MRIGQGFDVHALVEGRPLIIGGVTIPFERGLAGHSDADVLLHALCDALIGAAGLGIDPRQIDLERNLIGVGGGGVFHAAAQRVVLAK